MSPSTIGAIITGVGLVGITASWRLAPKPSKHSITRGSWHASKLLNMRRVKIDPNIRVRDNQTFSGLEDADGPVKVGDIVKVYEAESGLAGSGCIEEIDEVRRLIYLSVNWGSLKPSCPTRHTKHT